MKTAIIVDGAFFLKRLNSLYKNDTRIDLTDPKSIVNKLEDLCYKHLTEKVSGGHYKRVHDLYRIFFYDCPPITKKVHYPISHKPLDFATTDVANLKYDIHKELKKKRRTALRLGRLQDFGHWQINNTSLDLILKGEKEFKDLTDDDFQYEMRQKSVDMKIGIDITSLALKKQVDRIVLIAGDADFVPAAKLARREGIDFILDPMWLPIAPDLFEHIDGLKTTCPKPRVCDQ